LDGEGDVLLKSSIISDKKLNKNGKEKTGLLAEYSKMNDEINSLEQKLRELEQKENDLNPELLKKNIEDVEEKIKKTKLNINKYEQKVNIHENTLKDVVNKNVTKYIINDVEKKKLEEENNFNTLSSENSADVNNVRSMFKAAGFLINKRYLELIANKEALKKEKDAQYDKKNKIKNSKDQLTGNAAVPGGLENLLENINKNEQEISACETANKVACNAIKKQEELVKNFKIELNKKQDEQKNNKDKEKSSLLAEDVLGLINDIEDCGVLINKQKEKLDELNKKIAGNKENINELLKLADCNKKSDLENKIDSIKKVIIQSTDVLTNRVNKNIGIYEDKLVQLTGSNIGLIGDKGSIGSLKKQVSDIKNLAIVILKNMQEKHNNDFGTGGFFGLRNSSFFNKKVLSNPCIESQKRLDAVEQFIEGIEQKQLEWKQEETKENSIKPVANSIISSKNMFSNGSNSSNNSNVNSSIFGLNFVSSSEE